VYDSLESPAGEHGRALFAWGGKVEEIVTGMIGAIGVILIPKIQPVCSDGTAHRDATGCNFLNYAGRTFASSQV